MKNHELNAKNAINRIILLSKLSIKLSYSISDLNRARSRAISIPWGLVHIDGLDLFIDELKSQRYEIEQRIKDLLKNYIWGDGVFEYSNDKKYSLSLSELKDGYAILEKALSKDNKTGAVRHSEKYVLLLVDWEYDELNYFHAGTILPFTDRLKPAIYHALNNKIKITDVWKI